jgi:formylglycine-generating enzyme required for sulfatase activity
MKKTTLLLLSYLIAFSAVAQERRLALVIGNKNYTEIKPLANPINDARAMETALQECGFEVMRLENATKRSMENQIRAFSEKLKDYSAGLFFYAGHGMEIGGTNYIVPIDISSEITEKDVAYECVNTNWVQEKMGEAGAINKTNILILDACRNNPFRKIRGSREITADTWSPPKELPTGVITCYAASLGETASDGEGNNGLYTSILLRHIRTSGISIEDVFKRVRTELLKKGAQKPIESTSLTGDFYFVQGTVKKTPPPPVEDTYTPSSSPSSSNFTETHDGTRFDMVFVQGGSFQMGSDEYSSEKPIHQVTLSDFYIGKTEVTQRQWYAIMGTNPSYFKNCDDCPVKQVSWNDVQEFLQKLKQKTGKNYRLPTEAEWEYAARGGNKSRGYTYAGSNNIDDVAWYNSNSDSKTHSVAGKDANELGIYDMTGNVWEWCSDWYDENYYSNSPSSNPKGASSGTYRVLRGGSWYDYTPVCRAAYRARVNPADRYYLGGFRVCFGY